MLFNSMTFLLFFIVVYFFYRLLDTKGQNIFLLLASWFFYGAWDYRFLGLLFLSTITDFYIARQIEKTENAATRKAYLILSITISLGILGFFKYYIFAAHNITSFLNFFGVQISLPLFEIILPVGISFYTFQTMGYVIDIYRKKLSACQSFINFSLYVAFFPQLVAGPIERASHLLPQISQPRKIPLEKIREGSWLIFTGLFKKVVFADHAASFVNIVFSTGSSQQDGFMILLATYAFAIQIYCDFSGYTDIARGIAKWMGFELMLNFNKPYLAKNPSDFWQRWHISLSTFLKDYIYIPLGGNRNGLYQTMRNLMLTMLIGGLWHGAAWTFIIWGFYHGLLLSGHRLIKKFLNDHIVRIPDWCQILFFFHLVCLGWIFFRAVSLNQAIQFIRLIFCEFHFLKFFTLIFDSTTSCLIFILPVSFGFFYYSNYRNVIPKWRLRNIPLALRVPIIAFFFVVYLLTAVTHANQFIYFQF